MIFVIRHGQTDWNKEGRLQGRQGLPLNEMGKAQAANLRDILKDTRFDIVFSSPQERAIQTAEIVTGLSVSVDSRLDVYDLGEADGLKRSEVRLHGHIPDPHFYRGVEDARAFMKRIFDFMNELQSNLDMKDANLLISGHRCTTGCIGAYFNGLPSDGNILKYASENGGYKTYTFISG
ncbi:histidine phosphatase family protein [Paenibacillus antri]|uniref:Histidine phosphatase family protein n=1 Tax=Paenibacillus antri TaxID=2582848 RepID=A0A5R9GDP0_9BACL|nr:histidine phosphatase family protein [Paenibacillus antri]TLS52210.1 histidine phosphatase family protein [Paenibacillus antri]